MNDLENEEIHANLFQLLKELDDIAIKNNLNYYLSYGSVLGAVREEGFIPWDTDLDIMVKIDEYEKFCSTLESQIGKKFHIYSKEKDNKYTALFSRMGLKDIPHHKLHIDIFPMVGSPQSKIGKTLFRKMAYFTYMANYIKKINIKERLKGHNKVIAVVILGKITLFLVPSKLIIGMHNKLRAMFKIEDSDFLYNICGSYGSKEFIPKKWLEVGELKKLEHINVPVSKEWDKYLTHLYGDYMTPKKKNYI